MSAKVVIAQFLSHMSEHLKGSGIQRRRREKVAFVFRREMNEIFDSSNELMSDKDIVECISHGLLRAGLNAYRRQWGHEKMLINLRRFQAFANEHKAESDAVIAYFLYLFTQEDRCEKFSTSDSRYMD